MAMTKNDTQLGLFVIQEGFKPKNQKADATRSTTLQRLRYRYSDLAKIEEQMLLAQHLGTPHLKKLKTRSRYSRKSRFSRIS